MRDTKDQYDFYDVGNRCAAFRARKAARMVSRLYDEALRPADLKITQFTLLVAIKVSEPKSITELSDLLGLERTTLTRNLGVLKRAGLVTVEDEAQARSRSILITEKGVARLNQAYPYWKSAQTRIEKNMGEGEWQTARQALRSLGNLS